MYSWADFFVYSAKSPLLFSQYLFMIILTVVMANYSLLFRKLTLRNSYLFIFSLFFYYKTGGLYFFILLFSTIVDYYCGNVIHKSKKQNTRKALLILSLVINLGLLGFFKYSYFLVDQINIAFGTSFQVYNFLADIGNAFANGHFDIHKIILPVGISFYTFQTMSYTIDIYRRELEPARNIIDFGFFVSFFPQLVAGPIVRAAHFIPQIYEKYRLTRAEMGKAFFLIINGLIKKVLISDYISVNFVDRVFDSPTLYSGFDNLMAVYGYSLQIYCDFSGYSDMAIGLALLLGFRLPVNFNSPYKATSITDFWRRWHISLSSWLRDYLYISMGGNRKGQIRTYLHLLATMLLGGLWHGASLKFIYWGALHGIALALHKIRLRFGKPEKELSKLRKIIGGIITFHFVAYCWIFFRASDFLKAEEVLWQIQHNFDLFEIPGKLMAYYKVFLVMLAGYMIHWMPINFKKWIHDTFISLHDIVKAILITLTIILLYQVASADIQPFIYFQF